MVIDVYEDSLGRGTCRSCGAKVTWAEVAKSGKRMPLDGWDPVATRTQGSLLGGERVTLSIDTSITSSHFETCPDAKDWRRR